jgi:putative ABC transport system substrate-binding protein
MVFFREMVEAGAVMSYGPSVTGMYQRVAEYVDRIARGAKPGDLPIEQPTKFEFVLNLKTAKAIGLAQDRQGDRSRHSDRHPASRRRGD